MNKKPKVKRKREFLRELHIPSTSSIYALASHVFSFLFVMGIDVQDDYTIILNIYFLWIHASAFIRNKQILFRYLFEGGVYLKHFTSKYNLYTTQKTTEHVALVSSMFFPNIRISPTTYIRVMVWLMLWLGYYRHLTLNSCNAIKINLMWRSFEGGVYSKKYDIQ